MRSFLLPLLFGLLGLTIAAVPPAQAQRPSGNVGLGVQIGDPSGLTLRYEQAGGTTLEGLAAWDLSDDALFLSGHLIYERPLQVVEGDDPAYLYFGPGAYVGTDDDDLALGASGRLGLSFFVAPIELFIQVSPRFNLVPDTDFDLGGGLGARYYF